MWRVVCSESVTWLWMGVGSLQQVIYVNGGEELFMVSQSSELVWEFVYYKSVKWVGVSCLLQYRSVKWKGVSSLLCSQSSEWKWVVCSKSVSGCELFATSWQVSGCEELFAASQPSEWMGVICYKTVKWVGVKSCLQWDSQITLNGCWEFATSQPNEWVWGIVHVKSVKWVGVSCLLQYKSAKWKGVSSLLCSQSSEWKWVVCSKLVKWLGVSCLSEFTTTVQVKWLGVGNRLLQISQMSGCHLCCLLQDSLQKVCGCEELLSGC